MIRVDTKSPECGWEPFIAWIAQHGITAHDVRSVEVDEASMTATFEVFRRTNGRAQVKPGTNEVWTYTTTVPITELPPRR